MADLRERLAAAKVAASAIEGIAFKMNPPNIYTPQFVQLAQTIESALHEVLAHPEKLMGEPHKPSGASIRCPRCGEKQEVVFKYAAPTKEVKP